LIIIRDIDHRKFPRRSFDASVTVTDSLTGKDHVVSAIDINPMGVLIETRRPFTMGSVVDLSFMSPEGDYNLRLTGQVVRVLEAGPGRKASAGIEFFEMEDWILEELCAYVYAADEAQPLVLVVGPSAVTA